MSAKTVRAAWAKAFVGSLLAWIPLSLIHPVLGALALLSAGITFVGLFIACATRTPAVVIVKGEEEES